MATPASFPPEIIDLILSNLCGTPEILQCALVCQKWLPSARRHVLLPPKYLKLDQRGIVKLLDLFDSPHSTVSLINVRRLHLIRTSVFEREDASSGTFMRMYDPDGWKNDTTISDFFARGPGPVFPGVSSLSLQFLDWKTLSPTALASLRNNFVHVRELDLDSVAISFNTELECLLETFIALEKISIKDSVPYSLNAGVTEESGSVVERLSHPTLSTFSFSYRTPPWALKDFARTIGHTASAIELDMGDLDRKWDWRKLRAAFEDFFTAAGTTLRVLKIQFNNLGSDDNVIELFPFPFNPNLQELELGEVSEPVLKAVIRGLGMSKKPFLCRLKLALCDQSVELKGLEKWEGTWRLVDETLSSMSLKDPVLILDIRVIVYSWSKLSEDRYNASEKVSAQRKMEALLPRTAECWKLEVQLGTKCVVPPRRMRCSRGCCNRRTVR